MYNKASALINWLDRKLKLHNGHMINDKANWHVPRGAIYTCYLGENIGYEKGGLDSRPVLVVSTDQLNKKSGNVVIVPLSKHIKWEDKPRRKLKYDSHFVLYKSKYTKLNHDSAIQCEDIRVVSKSRLGDLVCFVDDIEMKKINKRLKFTFQI